MKEWCAKNYNKLQSSKLTPKDGKANIISSCNWILNQLEANWENIWVSYKALNLIKKNHNFSYKCWIGIPLTSENCQEKQTMGEGMISGLTYPTSKARRWITLPPVGAWTNPDNMWVNCTRNAVQHLGIQLGKCISFTSRKIQTQWIIITVKRRKRIESTD